jgi:hypothetical protein
MAERPIPDGAWSNAVQPHGPARRPESADAPASNLELLFERLPSVEIPPRALSVEATQCGLVGVEESLGCGAGAVYGTHAVVRIGTPSYSHQARTAKGRPRTPKAPRTGPEAVLSDDR